MITEKQSSSIRESNAKRYRVLVLEVDKARGAYAIANMEYLKDRTNTRAAAFDDAMNDLLQTQETLEKYVNEYGIPKPWHRY